VPPPENEHEPFSFYSEPGALTIEASADAGTDGKPALPRFSMVAYTGGPMRIAGWRYPVVVDLAGLSIPSQSRPIRFGHDMASGVGHTDSIAVADGKLIAAGVVSRDTAAAKEIVASARNGFPWQASLGAAVEQFEFVKEDQSVHVNGREFKGPVNVVRKATLGEISFVDLGADGNTTASVAARQARDGAASAKEQTTMKDTEVKQEQVNVEAAAQADVAGTPRQSSGQAGTAPVADPAPDIRAKAIAETKRIESIRKVCAGRHGTIEAKAIEEGWDENTTELEVLRAERPKAPVVHIRDNSAVDSDVLAAAVCLAGGLQPAESRFDDRTLEAAGRRFRSGIGLQELIMEAAWANGYAGRSFRSDMEGSLRAAFSTFSLPGILSNVANKFLLAGFESVEDTWRRIAATRNVRDFKAVTSYRLTGAFEYQEVGPTGELKHGQVDEESFTNQAKTYGRMFGVTRTDFINDDLGALTALPRKIGRGGALKLNKVFWTGYLNNAAFFTTGRANYQAGADTALSIDGLTAAELLFLEQKDAEGSPLGVVPSVLLVPPALLVRGTQFMQATELRDTTASTKYVTNNPHAGKFTVAHSAYLSNVSISGYSAKAWYLLADPNDLPVIEVAFLNGQQTPTVERADADFNVLGIQFRGYFDFGVALQEASATRLEAIPFTWHRGEVIAQG
jgi:phage major head subunit gpT-like protein